MKKNIYSLFPLAGLLKASNHRYLQFISTFTDPSQGIKKLNTISRTIACEDRTYKGFNLFDEDDPLFTVIGEYVKALRKAGLIESEMTERILKSSFSTMEAFNKVRNEESLAHDNPTLNYDESLLIFNHVCSTVRFIRALEARAERAVADTPSQETNDERFLSDSTHNNSMQRTALRAAVDAERWAQPSRHTTL